MKRGHAIAFQAQKQQHGDEKQDVTNVVYHCIISLPEKKVMNPRRKRGKRVRRMRSKTDFSLSYLSKNMREDRLKKRCDSVFHFWEFFPHCLALLGVADEM